jgi:cupin superfamily acireductone dioxygenase involved in methionine salvage
VVHNRVISKLPFSDKIKVAEGTPHSCTLQEVAFAVASCSFEMNDNWL